ncbi:DUF2971 domain-containing protein [Pandoraea sp. NE5]|uniref:DUF2971 domain-containing protein n=1 Tax=Pandoraea sp. NE5 TaxID=2904129 RepID=UPI0021C3C605|nr:DUF2971 domain-containing protein [Pandoraea sp. NE5]
MTTRYGGNDSLRVRRNDGVAPYGFVPMQERTPTSATMTETTYRAGFLNAFWWGADEKNISAIRRVNARYPFLFPMPCPPKIYHYTSVDGLLGIVKDRGFYMTHHGFLNDAVEISHGRDLTLHTLEGLAHKNRFLLMKDILGRACEKIKQAEAHEFYVTCFTLEADSLEQWRAYGGAGGVNIEISMPYGGLLGVGPRTLLFPVLYDDLSKVRVIIWLARKYLRELEQDYLFYRDKVPPDFAEEYATHFSNEIMHRIPTFKHNAFRSENEIRLVASGEKMPIHNRVRGRIIVPYLKSSEWGMYPAATEIEVPSLNITKIVVGPQPDRELLAKSVESFMRRCGYQNTEIVYSSAPYRN